MAALAAESRSFEYVALAESREARARALTVGADLTGTLEERLVSLAIVSGVSECEMWKLNVCCLE